MAQNIMYLHSDILSVISKEIELRGEGYLERNVSDENLLRSDEYLLRAPSRKKYLAQVKADHMSIIWRTS